MANICIISSSIRAGKKSNRVANYLKNYISEHQLASAEIIDLGELNFPLFEERLKFQSNPLPSAKFFAEKIKLADGVIIVSPEYNGGYPASIKNAIDLLVEEWKHKPVAISTVSSGPFAGSQAVISLQFSLWKIGAYTVPALFPVPNVESTLNELGEPADKSVLDKRAANFINELLWLVKANQTIKR